MKRLLKKSAALLCSVALLFTAVAFPPVKPAAASVSASLRLTVADTTHDLYYGTVPFTRGETVYQILKAALDAQHISYDLPDDPTYGRYVMSIGGETQAAPNYWSFYLNDTYANEGISFIKPMDGDSVTIALAGYPVAYPFISLSNPAPAPGDSVTVSVTQNVTDYATNTTTNQAVPGATVTFNHTALTADSNGRVTFTMPSTADTYPLTVTGTSIVPRTFDIVVSNSGISSDQRTVGANETDRTVDLSGAAVTRVDATGSATLKLAASGNAYSVPHALQTITRSGNGDYLLSFAAGTTVSGPAGWNGTFDLPQATGSPTISGVTVRETVSAGASAALTLDRPATLILPDQSGSRAGYLDESGVFHTIPQLPSNDPGSVTSDGYYDDGTDLIIYTRHFSTFVAYTPAAALNDTTVNGAIDGAAQYLAANDSSDWTVFALARAGKTVSASAYVQSVADAMSQDGGQFSSPTALEKAILFLRAAGSDPTRFNGVSLIDQLAAYPDLDQYGVTAYIYGLLALDSGNYSVPAGSAWTRDRLIAGILGYQKADGGFSLGGAMDEDPDLTAMALTALAPHKSDGAVSAPVQKAVDYLETVQQPDGGYISAYDMAESAESDAQVIIALSALGINSTTDERFAKYPAAGGTFTRVTILDRLLGFRQSSGAFSHTASGASDIFATQQSLMALTAYRSLTQNGASLYDLSGLTVTPVDLPADTQTRTQASSAADDTPNPQTGDGGIGLSVAAAAFALAAITLTGHCRRK